MMNSPHTRLRLKSEGSRVAKTGLCPDTEVQNEKNCMLYCVALYRSLYGSAEAEGRTQPFPEQQSSTDSDGTAPFTGS